MLPSESSRRVRLLTGLVLLGTFSAGILVGAGIQRWLRPHHHPPVSHLPLDELDLTPEQATHTHAIIEGHRAELQTILRGTYPRVRAVHVQIEDEVRAILSPVQRDKLDEIEARRPPPPPGPPPLPPPPPK